MRLNNTARHRNIPEHYNKMVLVPPQPLNENQDRLFLIFFEHEVFY